MYALVLGVLVILDTSERFFNKDVVLENAA